MSYIGQPERITQNRVVKLFQNKLGYEYLGNWEKRNNNSNIEEELLKKYLSQKGYSSEIINRAIDQLQTTAKLPDDKLYTTNKNVYQTLRYGAQVKVSVDKNFESVYFIDWKNPTNNHFSIAEEVIIKGENNKRPDIVIYVNGIALGVIELKRSTISIGDGIRQSIANQRPEFIQHFFTTIQYIFAGNDTAGLRYGTINTPEKYYLKWKEDVQDDSRNLLDKYLLKMCNKERFLEIIYDFVVFDGGVKKLPRVHQYFGIKEAQKHVHRKEGGIIWHTQGSGKSLVMVLLAKWILENKPDGRIVVITDRDELDKQIEKVFKDVKEKIYRSSSGNDLISKLRTPTFRLICSLVHKFGRKEVKNFERFIKELKQQPPIAAGDLFVFVDECHRTQSGKLHRTMKAMLPESTFIGFTGTPLLQEDKKTSMEVFGKYIHTYKFNEGVADGIILDLAYEARDIDQIITSHRSIDEWFDRKTRALNDFQRAQLRRRWATMQKVLSSSSRMEKIVHDILLDFTTKPRLSSDSGNAILVASSIYEACRYHEFFLKTNLADYCAIVTSYNPSAKDIKTEDSGSETERQFMYDHYRKILDGKSTENYEDESKRKFCNEPQNMKLLIVVSKLLTGFDAPSCTYLYIDKSMRDHGLFQAICRVNRLDGESKKVGYIVDYKKLLPSVQDAISVYTSPLDYENFEREDIDIMLQDRLQASRENLEDARNAIFLLCEPIPSRKSEDYRQYFCGNPEIPEDLKEREARRTALYQHVAVLARAYVNISDSITEVGYSDQEIEEIKQEVDFYVKVREEIRAASGETLDLKAYEADMRHLIDNYISASEPRPISDFAGMSLLEIVTATNIATAIENLPPSIQEDDNAIAETIENNIRRRIITENAADPVFFERMSRLLIEIIHQRRNSAIEYEEYLQRIAELARQVQTGQSEDIPNSLVTAGQRALFNNLDRDEQLAIEIDSAVKKVKKDDWRGNQAKEREIKAELFKILNDKDKVEEIFEIISQQREY